MSDDFRRQVHDAYAKAASNNSVFMSPPDPLHRMFDVPVFGRESARDFAETHAAEIRKHCLEAAQARRTGVQLPIYKFGNEARTGFLEALITLTSLHVTISGSTVNVSWA